MRKVWFLMLLWIILCIGCKSKQTDNQEVVIAPIEHQGRTDIQQVGEEIARSQSKGLDEAVTTVNRAYLYKAGYSDFERSNEYKLVAVDVTFAKYSDGFDLDDVDILDGTSNENYGSDPSMALLDPKGDFVTWDFAYIPDPARLMLIYAVPHSLESIKLAYWGKELTRSPISLDTSGPALPQPK